MKKNILILGLVLCTSTGLYAQKGDSTSKTKSNTQQKRVSRRSIKQMKIK